MRKTENIIATGNDMNYIESMNKEKETKTTTTKQWNKKNGRNFVARNDKQSAQVKNWRTK